MVSCLAWKTPRSHPSTGQWLCRLGRAWYGLILLLAALIMAEKAVADPTMEVSLDRNSIGVGESAVLSMTFTDGSPGSMPDLPTIANLQYGGQSSEQSYSLNGGSMSSKTTFSVELHPTKAGVYKIPSIEAVVDGTHLRSRPLTLRVLAGNPQEPSGGGDVAFLRITTPKKTVYVGEVLPVELDCYCLDNVRPQMPQFTSDDFILGELGGGQQQPSRVRIGNNIYFLFKFPTTATAIKAGTYALGPATWAVTVFGGQHNFFGWTESRQATFNSDAPQIQVLPVPTAGAPAGFSGALGNFTLAQYEAGPTTVNVGDPITLKVRIAGSGAFDTVNLPANADAEWREFKTYPATAKFDPSGSDSTVGSKYFEQVITAQNAEVKEIPPFAFSFFNPDDGKFHTLTHAPIPLTVNATAATPQPTVVSTGAQAPDAQEQGDEIVHIKPMMGEAEPLRAPLLERPGFLACQALAPMAWVCALMWRRQKEKLANNPRLRRKRRVAELVRAGLSDLAKFAAANDADKFYATVLQLLREQLGERLDLPAPAITEAVLDDLKGLRAETLKALHDLFHACNQYRYTPEHSTQEMVSLIPKIKSALSELQSMPATASRPGVAQGLGIILLLLGAITLRAQSGPDAFIQANKLYEEGKYPQAMAAYEKLTLSGKVSPALYFNLGNACLKSGKVGRAIVAYRQAELLAPRDPDVRANLQIARTQAGASNPALPGNRWTHWVGRLTLNEWTISTSAVVALFFILLTVREIRPEIKKSGGGLVVLLGLACLCLGSCLGIAAEQRFCEKFVVVTSPEAVARLGPLPESQSVFTLHDGAEMSVLGSDGDWLEVSDAARHTGWVAQKDVVFIP